MTNQLRSIYDRWYRLEEEELRDVEPKYRRLAYLARILAPIADDRSMFAHRAFRAAAQQIDWDKDYLRGVCKSVHRRGSFQAYLDWRRGPSPLAELVVAPLSNDAHGQIYIARVETFPHVIKIGFSRDPDRRMRQLQWETGEPHAVEELYAGTLVEEALFHWLSFRTHIVREWFFDPNTEDRTHPAFLPLGFVELRKLLEAE